MAVELRTIISVESMVIRQIRIHAENVCHPRLVRLFVLESP